MDKGVKTPQIEGWTPWPIGLHSVEEKKKKDEEEWRKEEEQRRPQGQLSPQQEAQARQ